MKSFGPITTTTLTIAIALLTVSGAAFAEEGLHGRISHVGESALIKGSQDADWSYATQNTLVLPGDTIWADEEGTVEVELPRGIFVRLADGSRVDIVDVPPAGHLKAWTGSFYFQRVQRSSGMLTVETPVARIDIEPDTQARIDILDDGSTTLTVRWGFATVRTEDGEPLTVAQGQRSYIDPGYLASDPESFDRGIEDAFDTWNRERARSLAFGGQSTPIASAGYADAPLGVGDLNDNGEWVYVDDTTYWKPYDTQYIPYRNGHWSYVPNHGHVWVGYQPYSYVTSHYGYWNHHDHHGWLWSYNHHYRPAYAATIRYGDLFVWAPIGVHGYPVHYGHDYYDFGGSHFYFGISSFSYSHHLLYGHHYSHSLHYSHVNHHNNYTVHHWNIDHRPNRPGGDQRPHRPGALQARDYNPQRVMRGPERPGTQTRQARDRVARLQSDHTTRPEFTARVPGSPRVARTPSVPDQRRAAVRNARVRPETLNRTRIANRPTRAGDSARNRQTTFAPDALPRNLTNTDARNSDPARVGRGTRPSGVDVLRGNTRPNTTGRVVRPDTSARPSPSNIRPSTRPTTTRPVNPQITRREPSRPAPRVNSTNRRPASPVVRQEPVPRSSRVDSTNRRPSPTVTRPAPSRPSYNPPTRRTAPSRPSYSPPSRSASPPRATQAPRTASPPRVSSAPRSSAQPRSAAPSRPSYGPPSRSYSQPSRSAPQVRSAPSRSAPSSRGAPSSAGRSHGPSRNR